MLFIAAVLYSCSYDSTEELEISFDGASESVANSPVGKNIIGTWSRGDGHYYYLNDGNGYCEEEDSYDGIFRSAFKWSVEDNVLKVVYLGSSTTYKYEVSISGESMSLTEIKKDGKKGNAKTYERINRKGTTTVKYKEPPFTNYVCINGYYYYISKAKIFCEHSKGRESNFKYIQLFGENESLSPTGVVFCYSTPYYEGITKEWSDGTYKIKSQSGFWIYGAFYNWRKQTSSRCDGTLTIKTVKSIKIFDFTLDDGEVEGHLVGNWSYGSN